MTDAVCPTCGGRHWLPLPMEQLPDEITWRTFDYYAMHEPRMFYDPCPTCNADGWWPFGDLPVDLIATWGDEPLDMTRLNPAFKKALDKTE